MNVLRIILCSLLAGTVCVAIAFLFFSTRQSIILDGAFNLNVRVRPSGERAIATLLVSPNGRAEDADHHLKLLLEGVDPDVLDLWTPIKRKPFNGGDVIVGVPFSERIQTPIFGPERLIGESQFQALLVFAILNNGERVGKVVQIPHRRQTTVLEVMLP